jgi:hypothetical protein
MLLELFDFHDIFYKEEHLVRIMTEFFYHSHYDVTGLHKRVLSDFSSKTMTVSEKWVQMIRQQTTEQLHSEDFLERVKRSAAYFEESINTIYGNSLDLASKIETNNKQAKTRFGDALAETRQAVLSRRYLLARIAELGFSINTYLHVKHDSLLDAIDERLQIVKRKPRAKKEPKPKKEPKEKTWNITWQLYCMGKKPEEIAQERNLTIGTIYGHLARFVESGDLSLSEIIPQERQDAIMKVIRRIGKEEGRTAIKNLCPPDVTYAEIELVLLCFEE